MNKALPTIPAFLTASIAAHGPEPALGFIRGGELHWRTWLEVADDIAATAAEIRAAGVRPGDSVAHISENRYEWVITDLAIHCVGAVHVPVHVTLAGEQIADQVADCGARLAFVSSAELLAKFAALIGPDLPVRLHSESGLGAIESHASTSRDRTGAGDQWRKLEVHPSRPDDLATILYTSGTTGRARGVMLSQSNLATNAEAAAESFSPGEDETRLCILPLSHIFARTCDLYTWVWRGSKLVLAENRDTTMRDLQIAKPTAMSAVPYLYQRIADKVSSSDVADPSAALREAFGGRMEHLTCGGAPLSPELGAWYDRHKVAVLVGYGLTETSPVVSASTPTARRAGYSGRAIRDIDVRIADDGEILVRGPNIMMGYWQNDQATAEAIQDGWFHTGDLGEIDPDGYLAIRGRKKELIVLSTGKKVVPTAVENCLTGSPMIEQAVVFGDGAPAIFALIVPAADYQGKDRATFAAEIARCLSSSAKEEQVREFAILERPLSIDRGELTAKLSLCRSVIAESFARELAQLREAVRSRPQSSTKANG